MRTFRQATTLFVTYRRNQAIIPGLALHEYGRGVPEVQRIGEAHHPREMEGGQGVAAN